MKYNKMDTHFITEEGEVWPKYHVEKDGTIVSVTDKEVNINTYRPNFSYEDNYHMSKEEKRQERRTAYIKPFFDEWLKELDKKVTVFYGLSLYDFPDKTYRDWYQEGLTPQEVFDEEFYAEDEDEMFRKAFFN